MDGRKEWWIPGNLGHSLDKSTQTGTPHTYVCTYAAIYLRTYVRMSQHSIATVHHLHIHSFSLGYEGSQMKSQQMEPSGWDSLVIGKPIVIVSNQAESGHIPQFLIPRVHM